MRVVILLCALLAVAGCRVDVVVDLSMADGTGELTVMATADADVVQQAPGLADDLRFDDAVAGGWRVEGPTATEAGGLGVVLRHDVSSAGEASALLASVGPPFADTRLSRNVDGDSTEYELLGSLVLANGFDSFADAELLEAVGGTPFRDELAGTSPSESMSVTLRATLPGEIVETTGEEDDDALEWQAPLDGSVLDVTARTEQRPGSTWASVLAVAVLVALIVWALLASAFIVSVIRVRGRRAQRRGLTEASAKRLEELEHVDRRRELDPID